MRRDSASPLLSSSWSYLSRAYHSPCRVGLQRYLKCMLLQPLPGQWGLHWWSWLTLVLAPVLVAALGLAAILSTVIIYDGESTWLEGLALIGLYGIIAVSFWWG